MHSDLVLHGAGTDRSADFHAHHAPVGALASFTIGRHAFRGGPGLELGKAVEGGVFAGYRDGDGPVRLLPFYPGADDDRARYAVIGKAKIDLKPFAAGEIRRGMGWCTDRWEAGDLAFEVLTPVEALPDPATAPVAAQRDAFAPAVTLRLTVANPGPAVRDAVLALRLEDKWLPLAGLAGLKSRGGIGFAVDAADAIVFANFDLEGELGRAHAQSVLGLGGTAGVRLRLKPGETRTLTMVVGFWREGPATIGRSMRYWYTRLFGGLEDVLAHALARAPEVARRCAARDAELAASGLPEERRFLVAHATRGYHASSQLLDDSGRPRWVVNEGEYLMLNTFDLTVDMAFWELRFSPWALADVVDQFAREYRYESRVFDPAEPGRLLPGGVTFCHDMGVNNCWSPAGRSSYEVEGLDRVCFSHMSCEQLTNWVLCAGLYWHRTRDAAFLARHTDLLAACQRSLLNRDHPEPARRRGFMQCEDERCRGGGEITTYDSLDHSLGQSRGNGYLAGKMWASHVVLVSMLGAAGREEASVSLAEARRCAAAIAASADPATGIMPSLLTDRASAPIIPAIEALAYPWEMGLQEACREDGPYGAMVAALKRHLRAVLREGACVYPDGGWKLSASADNSWASKIHLCQHVAEAVLGVAQEPAAAAKADRAHADWQRIGAANHAVSDQFRSGKAMGSLYYPRIVTSVLWLR
jgi:hypothetical protein